MIKKIKRRKLLLGLVIMAVLVVGGFYIPLGTKHYAINDTQNVVTDDIEITRYLLAMRLNLTLATGACDDVKVSSSSEVGAKLITLSESSQSELCTLNLKYQEIQPKVFIYPWQKNFIIRYYDATLLKGSF